MDLPRLGEKMPELLTSVRRGHRPVHPAGPGPAHVLPAGRGGDEDRRPERVAAVGRGVPRVPHQGDRHRVQRPSYGELPPVSCSPGQLNQAVMNILTNAIQSSSPGGQWASTTARCRRGADRHLGRRPRGARGARRAHLRPVLHHTARRRGDRTRSQHRAHGRRRARRQHHPRPRGRRRCGLHRSSAASLREVEHDSRPGPCREARTTHRRPRGRTRSARRGRPFRPAAVRPGGRRRA